MATKLKRFVRGKRTKIITFLLACVIASAAAIQTQVIFEIDERAVCDIWDVMTGNVDYTLTNAYKNELSAAYWSLDYARTIAYNSLQNYLINSNIAEDATVYPEVTTDIVLTPYYPTMSMEELDTYLDELKQNAKNYYFSFTVTVYNPRTGETTDRIFTNYDGDINEASFYVRNYTSLTIAMRSDYVAEQSYQFQTDFHSLENALRLLAVWLIILALLLILLAFGAGYNADGSAIPSKLDRMYTEITFAFCAAVLLGAILLIIGALMLHRDIGYTADKNAIGTLLNVLTALTAALSTAAWLPFYLALIRRFKQHSFFRRTWIWSVCRFFRRIIISQSLVRRTVAAVAGLGLLTMIPFAGIVTVPVAIWLSMRAVTSILEARDAVIDEEMGKRLNAERLRSELISNVSHDLRTPLTSVITYVDLLKNEPSGSDKIPEYVAVIESKAQRLKTLTDDLFEASKASSGNLPVALERIDLVSLITQGLGELDERIRTSALDFRVSLPPDALFVVADGKLLWRVAENLVSNALKYAMPGSRVYVSVITDGDMAGFEFKNVSNEPLGVSADELTERFVRGDRARTDGSSGLGLAIAKSLTEAMNGIFELSVDGDLFKARVWCKRE